MTGAFVAALGVLFLGWWFGLRKHEKRRTFDGLINRRFIIKQEALFEGLLERQCIVGEGSSRTFTKKQVEQIVRLVNTKADFEEIAELFRESDRETLNLIYSLNGGGLVRILDILETQYNPVN